MSRVAVSLRAPSFPGIVWNLGLLVRHQLRLRSFWLLVAGYVVVVSWWVWAVPHLPVTRGTLREGLPLDWLRWPLFAWAWLALGERAASRDRHPWVGDARTPLASWSSIRLAVELGIVLILCFGAQAGVAAFSERFHVDPNLAHLCQDFGIVLLMSLSARILTSNAVSRQMLILCGFVVLVLFDVPALAMASLAAGSALILDAACRGQS